MKRKRGAQRRILSDSDRFLDSIIENIPDMIFVKDARELRFVRFNRAGEELLGYRRDDLLGKNDYDFFPKEEADFFTRKDREVLASGKLLEILEEPIRTRKKGLRILHTKKLPILDEGGTPIYLLGISEDITEKKNLQDRLIEESKMAAIGRLVAGIAHEIRNPLFGISVSAQVLADAMPKRSDLDEISHNMQFEIRRLRHLLDDLLTYARPRQLQRVPVSPRTLVKEVLQLQAPLIEKKRLQMGTNFRPSGEKVMIDLEQFHQVMLNLLVNAVQASKEDGTVTIDSEVDRRLGVWVLKIHNGGDWIRPTDITQIYEPFFTTRADGSGLGLAIIKRIVEDHGGTVSVESSRKDGTTFTVAVPGRVAKTKARPGL